jgi:hypothetical protein
MLASGGSPGMAISQTCVDSSWLPFGILTLIGWHAGRMFWTGASVVKKLLVAPESAMAKFDTVLGVGIRGSVK